MAEDNLMIISSDRVAAATFAVRAASNDRWSSLDPGPRSSASVQHVRDPIEHVMHADGDIVDLAVMEAALFAAEDFECLLLRPNGLKKLFGKLQGNLLVAGAVQQ